MKEGKDGQSQYAEIRYKCKILGNITRLRNEIIVPNSPNVAILRMAILRLVQDENKQDAFFQKN